MSDFPHIPASLLLPLGALMAVIIDRLAGEPRRWHPLVGFGRLCDRLEKRLNRRRLTAGGLTWAMAVLPPVALAIYLHMWAPLFVDITLLYFALSVQSLTEHADAVVRQLIEGRLDDTLNYMPARCTAMTYALHGKTRTALRYWHQQAPKWENPNAGPVMAEGAGSLGIELGGDAIFHGQNESRPRLGEGPPPAAADLERTIRLIQRSLGLWLLFFSLIGAWRA